MSKTEETIREEMCQLSYKVNRLHKEPSKRAEMERGVARMGELKTMLEDITGENDESTKTVTGSYIHPIKQTRHTCQLYTNGILCWWRQFPDIHFANTEQAIQFMKQYKFFQDIN